MEESKKVDIESTQDSEVDKEYIQSLDLQDERELDLTMELAFGSKSESLGLDILESCWKKIIETKGEIDEQISEFEYKNKLTLDRNKNDEQNIKRQLEYLKNKQYELIQAKAHLSKVEQNFEAEKIKLWTSLKNEWGIFKNEKQRFFNQRDNTMTELLNKQQAINNGIEKIKFEKEKVEKYFLLKNYDFKAQKKQHNKEIAELKKEKSILESDYRKMVNELDENEHKLKYLKEMVAKFTDELEKKKSDFYKEKKHIDKEISKPFTKSDLKSELPITMELGSEVKTELEAIVKKGLEEQFDVQEKQQLIKELEKERKLLEKERSKLNNKEKRFQSEKQKFKQLKNKSLKDFKTQEKKLQKLIKNYETELEKNKSSKPLKSTPEGRSRVKSSTKPRSKPKPMTVPSSPSMNKPRGRPRGRARSKPSSDIKHDLQKKPEKDIQDTNQGKPIRKITYIKVLNDDLDTSKPLPTSSNLSNKKSVLKKVITGKNKEVLYDKIFEEESLPKALKDVKDEFKSSPKNKLSIKAQQSNKKLKSNSKSVENSDSEMELYSLLVKDFTQTNKIDSEYHSDNQMKKQLNKQEKED